MRPSDSPEMDVAATAQTGRAEFARFALENLFEFAPNAIFVTDSQGLIRSANPRACELFGYSQAEFHSMPVENLIPRRLRTHHPAHRENFNAHPRARKMGAALNLFAVRRDGTEFPVDVMLKPLAMPSGNMVLTILRDNTEEYNARQALRRSDIQLRSIMDAVQDYAIYLLDADGSVMTWNAGAERIKGYTADEIVGAHFSRFFTQEDAATDRPAELLRLAAMRGRVEEEAWRVRKDGSRFWADVVITAIRDDTGALTGFAKVTRDFTDRKRAEEAVMLQLSSALLSSMDFEKLLTAISASIHEVAPHDSAALALYDSAAGDMIVQFLAPYDTSIYPGEPRVPVEGTLSGQVFKTREPVLLETLEGAPHAPESMRTLARLGMASGCWVPLIHHGKAIGTLGVLSRMERAFGTQDVAMLARIAVQVAMAVDNSLAFRRIAELRDKLRQEKQYLQDEINLENRFEDIVGESAGLRRVLKEIETVAPTNATVLIQGETGTGKELLARSIHRLSPRHERTFIKLNCAAIPAGLIESELFGHEKGAFTGAIARKIGRLELAHEGTLFLDEVGELPLDLQPKLLRALQEREIERLGGIRPISVDIRLIAATNRDLAQMVQEKQFRSDLYYRLRVFPIFAPPLRERAGDIPVLVQHFVATHSRRMGKSIQTIPDETMNALIRWPWPGNIRELENFLERAVILTRGPVLYVPLAELETKVEEAFESAAAEGATLHEAEREHILRVLRETGGQIGGPDGAAERLGLKRTTLNSKMKKLGIERGDEMKSR
jgi:formate hydrogenlyase transcriptional activator